MKLSLCLSCVPIVYGIGGQTPHKPACQPPHDFYKFCNASLSIDDRVADLMKYIPDAVKPNLLTARGGPKGLQNLSAVGVPPYYWGTNCVHSLDAPCTEDGHCPTNFPSGPSMAATFDRERIQQVADIVGRELRALYNIGVAKGLDCWGPVINLNRDPRWGRNGEGGAEDPYLMGELAAAWTRGFQEGRRNDTGGFLQGILTLKHYAANSLENTLVEYNVTIDGHTYTSGQSINRHTMDVNVSNYMLQQYLAAFRSAAKAGARGMMCSYNSVNGIPTCLSPLMKSLRELWTGRSPWGGYITSDSDSVADAVYSHHYVNDSGNASCLAVRDGGDDIDSGNTYYDNLLQGVKAGYCSMDDVDAAIARTLKLRFELGLFDSQAKQPLTRLNASDVGTESAALLNLRATAESLVLLKNDGILPLKAGQKIAVVGPHANASRSLVQVDTGMICGGDGTFDCVESPFEAVKRLNVGGHTTLAVGCDIMDHNISTRDLLDEALTAAKAADVVVLALGIAQCGCMGITDTYMGGKATNPQGCATSVVPPYKSWGNCWNHKESVAGQRRYIGAEEYDRMLIDLPPVQHDFASEILKLGKPCILVLLNGGSIDIGPELRRSNAAIEAFYPGVQGAGVIANALFAKGPDFNRFGRMPYTTYAAGFVHESPMMEHDMSVAPGRTHQYYRGQAVIPFGFGLSYSSFEMSLDDSTPSHITLATDGSRDRKVSLLVKNKGPFIGDVVVLAFLKPLTLPTQPGSRLVQKLWQFDRISDVQVDGVAHLEFKLSAEAIALNDLSTGDIVCAPGNYELWFSHGDLEGIKINLIVQGSQHVIERFPRGKETVVSYI